MPLNITIPPKASGSSITIGVAGSLDTATAPELDAALKPILATDVVTVVFDLKDLTFISSAGLRVLVGTGKLLKVRGGSAVMINQQPQIAEVFKIVAALPGVSIFASVQEMDNYLAGVQRRVVEGG